MGGAVLRWCDAPGSIWFARSWAYKKDGHQTCPCHRGLRGLSVSGFPQRGSRSGGEAGGIAIPQKILRAGRCDAGVQSSS